MLAYKRDKEIEVKVFFSRKRKSLSLNLLRPICSFFFPFYSMTLFLWCTSVYIASRTSLTSSFPNLPSCFTFSFEERPRRSSISLSSPARQTKRPTVVRSSAAKARRPDLAAAQCKPSQRPANRPERPGKHEKTGEISRQENWHGALTKKHRPL